MGKGEGGGGGGGGGDGGGGFRFVREPNDNKSPGWWEYMINVPSRRLCLSALRTRILGPPPVTMVALNRVAKARGLRDVDELLGCLGKPVHEISTKEAMQLLREECSPEEFQDAGLTYLYGPGKGYRPCNNLLKEYLKGIKESDSPGLTRVRLKELKKYCGYTDDELNSLM